MNSGVYLSLICVLCIAIFGGIWYLWRQLRHKPQAVYLCLDGHLVRSRGEWMIDAALQYLGISHEYEPRIEINRQVFHPDFKLKNGVYLEYWGLNSRSYRKLKHRKQKVFGQRKFKLINIENADLKNLLFILDKKLNALQKGAM